MHEIFKQWYTYLLPVTIKDELDSKGKKQVEKFAWTRGQKLNKNSVALMTGSKTVNVIDVDTKDLNKLEEPFKSWCDDRLMFSDTLIVETKSGYHFYFYSDKKIKTSTKISPFVDVRGEGGVIFVHSDSKVAHYEVACDEQPTKCLNELEDVIPKAVEREHSGKGYSTLDELERAVHLDERPSREKMEDWLSKINANCDYQTWSDVLRALNSWDLDGEDGLELAITWSQSSDAHELSDDEIAEKYHQNVADVPSFYKKIVGIANRKDLTQFEVKILSLESESDFEALAEEISESTLNNKQREDLAEKLATKEVELGLSSRKRGVHWKKQLSKKQELHQDLKVNDSFKVYRLDNKYLVRIGDKIIEKVSPTMLKEVLASFGFKLPKEHFAGFKESVKTISRYRKTADYCLNGASYFVEVEGEDTLVDELVCKFNPLSKIKSHPINEDAVKEFFDGVWAGKLYGVIKLIGLTIRFKEEKLNRLMVVAPSNSGKSEIFTMLNFQKINMERLINSLRGNKGVGKDIVDGLKASELLLIDEANKSLEQDIKYFDGKIQLDQFGGDGGTQLIPLQFTALTSTHTTATRTNSDELSNRFLQVELKQSEMLHTVTDGVEYQKNPDEYTKSVKAKLIELFKDALNGEYTLDDLNMLRSEFKLPTSTDLDELLFTLSEEFISETRGIASSDGDIIHRHGEYYYKRKGDVHKYFLNRLSVIEALDAPKYAEKLTNHFIREQAKNIKIDKVSIKYYKLFLFPFTEDESQIISSMFDDLDIEDL